MTHIIGMDVSKLSLDCAYVRDVDRHQAKRKRVTKTLEGFIALVSWAKTVSGLCVNEIRFIVEPSSVYHELLVQFLNQRLDGPEQGLRSADDCSGRRRKDRLSPLTLYLGGLGVEPP